MSRSAVAPAQPPVAYKDHSQSSIMLSIDSSTIKPIERADGSNSALTSSASANKVRPKVSSQRPQPPGVLDNKEQSDDDEEDEGRIIQVQQQAIVIQGQMTRAQQNQQNQQPQHHHHHQNPQHAQHPPHHASNAVAQRPPPAASPQYYTPNGPVQSGGDDDDVDSGSYYSDESSSEDESPRENRVLTFADEHGHDLCNFCFYEVEAPVEDEEFHEAPGAPPPTRQQQNQQSCMGKCIIS